MRCGTQCIITHVIRTCIITSYDHIYSYISVRVERSREVTHGVVVLKDCSPCENKTVAGLGKSQR